MVGMMFFCLLVSSNCREQKKLARKMFCASLSISSLKCPATVQAMVDFPDPASPVNQKIRELFGDESWAH
jgi:hypothetical protein